MGEQAFLSMLFPFIPTLAGRQPVPPDHGEELDLMRCPLQAGLPLHTNCGGAHELWDLRLAVVIGAVRWDRRHSLMTLLRASTVPSGRCWSCTGGGQHRNHQPELWPGWKFTDLKPTTSRSYKYHS